MVQLSQLLFEIPIANISSREFLVTKTTKKKYRDRGIFSQSPRNRSRITTVTLCCLSVEGYRKHHNSPSDASNRLYHWHFNYTHIFKTNWYRSHSPRLALWSPRRNQESLISSFSLSSPQRLRHNLPQFLCREFWWRQSQNHKNTTHHATMPNSTSSLSTWLKPTVR